MKTLLSTVAVLALSLGISGGAFADKASAPGQDKTCVTTASDDSRTDASILAGKWLPQKAADKQIAKGVGHAKGENPKSYDYAAKETCDSFPS